MLFDECKLQLADNVELDVVNDILIEKKLIFYNVREKMLILLFDDCKLQLADNLELDVVKSLESLNEEIRDTLPWTTPAPGSVWHSEESCCVILNLLVFGLWWSQSLQSTLYY